MLEKITSICYVSYHIRSEKKNQLKIQKILCVMSENLTCINLIRMKSTYAIRSDNWYNILTIKNVGMRVGKIHTRKLFICFCLAVVLFVPIHTFADEKESGEMKLYIPL